MSDNFTEPLDDFMASKWVFVTGTGTDVGKTYCAAKMAEIYRQEGRRVGVYKPVASGCVRDQSNELVAEDASSLWQAAGQPLTLRSVCPQRFEAPLAPPEAAEAMGQRVDERVLIEGMAVWNDDRFDVVLIEGAGGLFSPISENMLNIDFGLKLQTRRDLDVVLIAANRLGVQHDVIAAVRAAVASGFTIDRVILNTIAEDASSSTNAENLRRWIEIPVHEDCHSVW